MALLFQSNPDQWDLRRYFTPGERESWFVSRHLAYMKSGVLTLLWEAQGSKDQAVRGLYGWGVTLDEPSPDKRGRLRIPLQYIERWICTRDVAGDVPKPDHSAALAARDVLSLPSWKQHQLNTMPIGTNFLVLPVQLRELRVLVEERYPNSALPRAIQNDIDGSPLVANDFEKRYIKQGRA